MLDKVKVCVQVASSIGEASRRTARDVARQIVAGHPASRARPDHATAVGSMVSQASSVADELLTIGRENRELWLQVVRTEVGAARARFGTGETEDLRVQVTRLQKRVQALERELDVNGERPPRSAVAPRAAVKRAAVKKTAVKKAAVTEGAVEPAVATRSTTAPEETGE